MNRNSSFALVLASLLSAGCSFLYQSEPPDGCVGNEDADGDGFRKAACGGRDCDDTDRNIHPDATEVCFASDTSDDTGVDEDCNPNTTSGDLDGDGQEDEDCFNVNAGGLLVYGTDCDDNDPMSFARDREMMCDGVDNDCDELVDEGLIETVYIEDCDGDGAGANDERESLITCLDLSNVPEGVEAPEGPTVCEGGTGQWVSIDGDCDDEDATRQASCGSCSNMDLLIVIDDTPTMLDEQLLLATAFPTLLERLASGDVLGDGTLMKEPIESLHVGIISPDLGTGGAEIPGCAPSLFGLDGELQSEIGISEDDLPNVPVVRAAYEACPRDDTSPSFIEYQPDGASPGPELEQDLRCRAVAGTQGCEVQQPLEAALKALTPASSSLRFFQDTLGNGDSDFNRDFLRDDSLLVVVVISDEDDCSVRDESFYSSVDGGDPDLACALSPTNFGLHSVTRYVSGLLALRPSADLIFGAVAGVPNDLLDEGPPDFQAIFTDPRMRPDGSAGVLRPSCDIPQSDPGPGMGPPRGGGPAFPPVRTVELADRLSGRGAQVALSSICSPRPYADLVERILLAGLVRSAERCGSD